MSSTLVQTIGATCDKAAASVDRNYGRLIIRWLQTLYLYLHPIFMLWKMRLCNSYKNVESLPTPWIWDSLVTCFGQWSAKAILVETWEVLLNGACFCWNSTSNVWMNSSYLVGGWQTIWRITKTSQTIGQSADSATHSRCMCEPHLTSVKTGTEDPLSLAQSKLSMHLKIVNYRNACCLNHYVLERFAFTAKLTHTDTEALASIKM